MPLNAGDRLGHYLMFTFFDELLRLVPSSRN
jgi:hypothetical protein